MRRTSDLCGHVRKLRDAQCDVLSPQALQALDAALRQTKTALESNADKAALAKSAADLEKAANKWLRPFPMRNGARTSKFFSSPSSWPWPSAPFF